jgi:hypothetical protein
MAAAKMRQFMSHFAPANGRLPVCCRRSLGPIRGPRIQEQKSQRAMICTDPARQILTFQGFCLCLETKVAKQIRYFDLTCQVLSCAHEISFRSIGSTCIHPVVEVEQLE